MCTTNKNKPKKKYTHPPMEDSSKLEDFECLEYSKHLIDYGGNIGYSNEGFPIDVVSVNFGNGERMFLPLNNYDINIQVQDLGYEKSVKIRAENLATGETRTHMKVHPVPTYRMGGNMFLSQNSGRNTLNNGVRGNSRNQYFQDDRLVFKLFTIHVSSYKEPELISNNDISWLNDWWSTDHSYTTEYGDIYTRHGGGGNENHKARTVGCMTSLNSLFGAFGGGIAGRLGSGNWTDFFGKLSDFLQQLFSPMPVMHEQIRNKRDTTFNIISKLHCSQNNIRSNKCVENEIDGSGNIIGKPSHADVNPELDTIYHINKSGKRVSIAGGRWNGEFYNDGDTTGFSVVHKEGLKTILIKDSIYESK